MGVVEAVETLVRHGTPGQSMYACNQCDTQLDLQYHQCPHCGGFCIDRVDWEIEES